MQVDEKVFCSWDLISFLSQDYLKKKDGTMATVSLIDGKQNELMIFLDQNEKTSYFEVKVYKANKRVKYEPSKWDNIISFESNDRYDKFLFRKFKDALKFVATLGYIHPEYKKRPVQKLKF